MTLLLAIRMKVVENVMFRFRNDLIIEVFEGYCSCFDFLAIGFGNFVFCGSKRVVKL